MERAFKPCFDADLLSYDACIGAIAEAVYGNQLAILRIEVEHMPHIALAGAWYMIFGNLPVAHINLHPCAGIGEAAAVYLFTICIIMHIEAIDAAAGHAVYRGGFRAIEAGIIHIEEGTADAVIVVGLAAKVGVEAAAVHARPAKVRIQIPGRFTPCENDAHIAGLIAALTIGIQHAVPVQVIVSDYGDIEVRGGIAGAFHHDSVVAQRQAADRIAAAAVGYDACNAAVDDKRGIAVSGVEVIVDVYNAV